MKQGAFKPRFEDHARAITVLGRACAVAILLPIRPFPCRQRSLSLYVIATVFIQAIRDSLFPGYRSRHSHK
jgi:hypothetical protein